MTCIEISKKKNDYVDGLLAPSERQAFEAHLDQCEDCQKDISDTLELVDLLKELPMEPLPEDFEATLHEALLRESTQRPRRFNWSAHKRWQKTLGYTAALFLVALVGIAGLDSLRGTYSKGTADMAAVAPAEYGVVSQGLDGSEAKAASDLKVTFSEAAPATEGLATADVATTVVGNGPSPTTREQGADFDPSVVKRIQRGSIAIEVIDYKGLIDQITTQIELAGGYIESSNEGSYTTYRNQEAIDLKQGNLVLRMPQDQFLTIMHMFDQTGKITNSSMQTQDVSAMYRDTYNEMKNLETREEALREIMKKAQTVTEILEVDRELSAVRGQINAYAGTLTQWDRLVDMSTIEISITEVVNITTQVNPPRKDMWQKSLEALIKTVNQIVGFSEKLIIFIVGALPIWGPLVAVGGIYAVFRRIKKAKMK